MNSTTPVYDQSLDGGIVESREPIRPTPATARRDFIQYGPDF
ncbi:hypothetical protein AA0113_g3163 [Alternaria arborescens]|uniref:Uncharacterized protein n=1 Tax=Alternaria arborescens TaxID=156630 RepID=A0A4Q4SII4_9PLEO|nr:hypothetical protein AA0111_g2234 [Alternaria arborescens]RYN27950.1 hypothetical protein AA0112_g7707 [Alternaria arborescens]RYO37895.1 hypothetical protein AA0111_g2234 [Alternaria arborescens]RYO70454.1 hypothetical protein AA0113_g3163 [Alternaria arborescens]